MKLFPDKKGLKKSLIFGPFFPGKKGMKNFGKFLAPFPDKKGMEMWQIVFLLLAVLLLIFLIFWFGILGGQLGDLFGRLEEVF